MQKAEVEIFSDAINAVVVRTQGRRFPGIVIQGDTLAEMYRQARAVVGLAEPTGDQPLIDAAGELFVDLWAV